MEKIKEYFDYLFDDYEFDVISQRQFESFGNWVVVLESDDCRLRIFRDRGEISMAAGPLWSPPGWKAGPWFDLTILISFLTEGEYMVEYELGDTDQQLKRLASIFYPFCDQICKLFQDAVYQQKRDELEQHRKQIRNQLWEQLGENWEN